MELVGGNKATDGHLGCVARKLTFRDRLLILQALGAAVTQGGDIKTLGRLVKIQEILDCDGVDEFFGEVNKNFAKRLQAWATLLERHIKDPVTEADPGAKPEQSEQEEAGPEQTFWIKAKLDEHIASTIGSAKFSGANAKHAVSLLTKYGIQIED